MKQKSIKNIFQIAGLSGVFIISFIALQFFYDHFLSDMGRGFVDDIVHYSRSYDESYTKGNSESYHGQDNVVVVKIDDKTLNATKQGDIANLNITRAFFAKATENLFEKYGAGVVGYDIVFANRTGKNDENAFIKTLEKYKNRIVLGTRGDESLKPFCAIQKFPQGATDVTNKTLDVDTKIRRIRPEYITYKDDTNCGERKGIYHFGVELYKRSLMHFQEMDEKDADATIRDFIDTTPTANTESGALHYMYLNFFLNPSFVANPALQNDLFGYPSYSLLDIYEGKAKDDKGNPIDLKDKIVLIGEVGTLFQDKHLTPTRLLQEMPGVEIQANTLQTIINSASGVKPYRIPLSDSEKIATLLFTSLFLLFGFGFINRYCQKHLLQVASPLASMVFAGMVGFVHWEIGYNFTPEYLYPVANLLYVVFATFVCFYLYLYLVIEKNKRFLKTAFSRYVSPDMVNLILQNPEKLSLQGEEREVSVFFSDIAGFTSLSEKMSPQELFVFLNTYLEQMTIILQKNKGTLDKYIGDAVMGFFNAPLPVENHPYAACQTAIEQINALKQLNADGAKKGWPELSIRIGISTGQVVQGNLGSSERFNYTIIGDEVNLASRLEGINKYYHTNICISSGTYERIKGQFVTRELDRIRVKGKEISLTIYELLTESNDEIKKIITNYEQALSLYYKAEYSLALALFEIHEKTDGASQTMAERCRLLLAQNRQLIDGVFTMDAK